MPIENRTTVAVLGIVSWLFILFYVAMATSCTVPNPGAGNRTAYRHYDWSKGDSGNAQYEVHHFANWPRDVWRDDAGNWWIEKQHPRRFEKGFRLSQ